MYLKRNIPIVIPMPTCPLEPESLAWSLLTRTLKTTVYSVSHKCAS